jgi:ATP-binding cassette, subfamily B, bacterial
VLARALRLFAPYRRRVAVWLAVILVASVIGVVAPLLTKVVFDDALFPSSGDPDLGLLVALVALMIAAVVIGGVLAIVQTYLANVVGQGVMHDLRRQLYAHLRQMSLGFFTSTRTGEIQSRIANDVGGVGLVVTQSASIVLSNAVFVLASFAAMAYLSWQLALVSLVILPVFVLFSRRVGRVRRELSTSAQQSLAEMSVITQETLSVSGALLTRLFDTEGMAARRYGEESERLAALRVRQEMAGRVFLGVSQTFLLAAPALLYLAAGLLLAEHSSLDLTPGTLVAFSVLQSRLFFPVRELAGIWLELQTSAALFERVFEYLDLPHDVTDSPTAREVPRARVRGSVALRDVSFSYEALGGPADGRPHRRTLENISLSIEAGQLAAIVGPTGAGKTTITYLVSRLYDVSAGAVEIDGIDVREIQLASLADIVSMVTQETYLLHASVRENLLYARPDARQVDLERATRAALIHDRILELPDGYDTIVGERGYRLSGGEKQRVSIARVLLKDPQVLILDEATSALDTVSERLVQEALQSLVAGRTTIAIAHRLSTILAADVIFVLDDGRLVERGTHEALLARGGLYSRLYQQQFESGLVEARCEDGVVLASGDVVSTRVGSSVGAAL